MARPEERLLRDVELALGALPGVIVYRNATGTREVLGDGDGTFWLSYGLGEGTPDLVFLLRLEVTLDTGARVALARMVGIETKSATGRKRASQLQVQRQWHAVGCFYAFVRSVDQARAALERARQGALE